MNPVQWRDFSSVERDNVLDLLAAQKDKSTQDELGVGLVRDAIADHMFPPLSTIQTRAKYFLYVPWILRALERGNVGAERLVPMLRQREIKLIGALLDSEAEDKQGLIGRESREATKRLPSSIYWSGVRRLGIFQGAGSLAEYLNDLPEARLERRSRQVEPEGVEMGNAWGPELSWDIGLPVDEPDFLTQTSFALRPEHARYLKERILSMSTATGRSCLLQWMICHLAPQTLVDLTEPWQLLHSDVGRSKLPEHLQTELVHARNFSLCMRVLTAVYFRLLAVERRDLDAASFDAMLAASMQSLAALSAELTAWHANLPAFWQWVRLSNPRLQRDQPFIDEWLQILAGTGFSPVAQEVLTSPDIHRRFRKREHQLKGELARLGNAPVLQRWNAPDVLIPMDFRWRTARQVVCDILQGFQDPKVPPHA